MKLTRIFGVVLALHFAVVGTLLVQPGCQNTKQSGKPRPTAGETVTGPGAVEDGMNAPLTRQPPTRPPLTSTDEYGAGEMLEQLQPAAPEPSSTTYVVQKGDSLSKIATRHGIKLQALLDANHLTRDSIIRPEQELIIPAPDASAPSLPTPEEVPGLRYVVKRGDALSKIARAYQVSVADIKAANSLTSDNIRVDQVLVIPGASSVLPPTPVSAVAPGANTYTVQKGDVISAIARRFGVSANELMSLNGISDPRKLRAGQVLRLPTGASAGAAAPKPIAEKEAAVVREENRMNNVPPAAPATNTPAPVTITPSTNSTMTPPPADPYSSLERLDDAPETPTLEVEDEGTTTPDSGEF